MEIGVDSFASAMYGANEKNAVSPVDAMEQLLERMELADQAGLDVFGIGEHHKKDFLDSATVVILAAAAGALLGELLPARPIGSATASPRTTHAGRAAPAHARPNR